MSDQLWLAVDLFGFFGTLSPSAARPIIGYIDVARGECLCRKNKRRRSARCWSPQQTLRPDGLNIVNCQADGSAELWTCHPFPATKVEQCTACQKFKQARYVTLPTRPSNFGRMGKGGAIFKEAELAVDSLNYHADLDGRFCSVCNMGFHRAMRNIAQCEEAIEGITQWQTPI